jgi:hypothetical protein
MQNTLVQHEPTKSTTNPNAKLPVALPSGGVQGDVKPSRDADQHGKNNREYWAFGVELAHHADPDHQEGKQGPDPEKAANGPGVCGVTPTARAFALEQGA